MRLFLISLFLGIFLISCNSIVVKEEGSNIKSVSVVRSGPPGPWFKASTSLTLSKDLLLTAVRKNRLGKVEKRVKKQVTQAQFDHVIGNLKTANLSKLKSKMLEHAPLGGSISTILLETDQQTYSYSDGYKTKAPQLVRQLVTRLGKLVP